MIEKTIHYCWFGGNPLPKLAKKCIASWQKYCPDYKIIQWDETNFDINCNEWCREMYKQKKWAFLSDYARLKIIYEMGGIYLDTDVELVKGLDPLVSNSCFMGFDTTGLVNNGLGFGAEKHNAFIKNNMDEYDKVTDFNSPELNSWITTRLLEKYNIDCESKEIQFLGDITVYPSEYFCSKHTHTGLIEITPNTFSIHHFECSWDTEDGRKKQKDRWKKHKKEYYKQAPKRLLRRIVGNDIVDRIKRLIGNGK